MRHSPVHWSEGMFLRPHHFQAADRFWSEVVQTSEQWDHHYNYGLRTIRISAQALANYQLEVSLCNARLRDGTLVALDQGRSLERRDLKPAFVDQSQVTAYIGVPKLSLGRRNVASAGAPADCRYTTSALSIQDANEGANDQDIQLLDLNVRLLLSTDDLGGFEILPVARIKRASAAEAIPQLDEEYFPPLLAVDAWDALDIGLVRPIYDLLGEKIHVLSQRVAERGVNLASQEPGDLDDIFLLHTLNQSYAALGCLAFARGVHPLTAYTELCRVVGLLSIFGESRRVENVPPYDHDDLARIFRWIQLRIVVLLDRPAQPGDYEMRPFVGTAAGMEVQIKSHWLHDGWQWFVGVKGEDVREEECRLLLKRGMLDWKMGSSQDVDLIFRHGLPGVEQVELSTPPRNLPARQGWLFYRVTQNPDNAAWRSVLATRTLALRFKREMIANLDKLPGQHRLEISFESRRAILQFALFAVAPTQ